MSLEGRLGQLSKALGCLGEKLRDTREPWKAGRRKRLVTQFLNKNLIPDSGLRVLHPEAVDLFPAPIGTHTILVGP